MARQVQIDRCTRCNAKGVGVFLTSEMRVPDDDQARVFEAFGRCGVCRKTMIFRIETAGHSVIDVTGSFAPSEKLLAILPTAATATCPSFVPEAVSKPFIEGVESILNSQWNAAGAMLRRSIERAVKNLDEGGKGDLKTRIDALATKGLIIRPMAEWAHEVRLGGNDAVHDEDDLTPEEAEVLRSFATAFLEAAYTMPKLVATGRATAMVEAKKRGGSSSH